MSKRVTTRDFLQKKRRGERIVMLTAYDFPTARLVDSAGVDAILVGDSLGMVVQGHAATLQVTLEQMVYHASLVARATERALVVADMPFLSFQVSPEEALRNAGRLLQEGGAQAVKLEGGAEVAPTVSKLVTAGIPVMGHVGLTPQSVHALGGMTVQGRTAEQAARLLRDARALEEAGAFALVLELVPYEVAVELTGRLAIPTIGIGSGPGCDGQVLVLHDMVGLLPGATPRHAKRYAEVGRILQEAVAAYAEEVRKGVFPTAAESRTLGAEAEAVVEALRQADEQLRG